MNAFKKLLCLLIFGCLILGACGGETAPTAPETTAAAAEPAPEVKDWAAQIQPSADTLQQALSVKVFIDGDTVHFHVPEDVMAGGVLKARFLAVNTPESTGKIEEYGKKASEFTKEKLSGAESVLVESEDGNWNADSTGERYLVWVWYKPQGSDTYRNLNVELLQEGLAIANSAAGNRYGETCVAAIAQAKQQKKNLYSGEKDPDFYYGDAVELTLRELRTNIESYSGMKVAFSGAVIANSGSQGVYIEDYDAETDRYYGMYVYYGHGLSGTGLEILSVGNLVRIVGSVQFYEAGGTWQVSDLTYRMMKPDDPGNIQKLGEGCSAAWTVTPPECFDMSSGDAGEASWAELALGTSVEMQNLTVVDAYTTENAESSSNGAITLYCERDGIQIVIRTLPLTDGAGNRITQDIYLGKTVDVKGIVEYYDGTYQIKVLSADHITILV